MTTMQFGSIAKYVTHLGLVAAEMHFVGMAILLEAAVAIRDEAQSVIGTYKFGWPPLQPETVARKGADTPLLETGELRDSISIAVAGRSVFVGSDLEKAVWHELGTSKVPARSFLWGATNAAGIPAIDKAARKYIPLAFSRPRHVHSIWLDLLLHAVREISGIVRTELGRHR